MNSFSKLYIVGVYAHSPILSHCVGNLLIRRTGSRPCCGKVPSFIAVLLKKNAIENNQPWAFLGHRIWLRVTTFLPSSWMTMTVTGPTS